MFIQKKINESTQIQDAPNSFWESLKRLTGAEQIKNMSANINKTQRTSQNRYKHGCLNGEQSG